MRKEIIAIIVLLCSTAAISCEDDIPHLDTITGKWRYVKAYDPITGHHLVPANEQSMVEYRKDKTSIVYDYSGIETARSNYDITDSKITISGRNLNGELWNNESSYWFKDDTLVIRADGGFEYIDNYWIRTK